MIHEKIHLCADDENVTLTTYLYDTRKKKSDAVLVIPGGGYQLVCGDREGEDVAKHYGNVSDDDVENFPYDYYYDNNAPLEQTAEKFAAFLEQIAKEQGVTL